MRHVLCTLAFLTLLADRAYADASEDAKSAVKAFADGNFHAAEALFTEAIDSGQLDEETLIVTLSQRCGLYAILAMYDRALADCNRAIQLDATFSPAHLNIAAAYMKLGKPEEAIAETNLALRYGRLSVADTAMAYSNRGGYLILQGQYKFAIDDLTKAIEINPGDFKSYGNRGSAYIGTGELDKALKDAEAALRINRNAPNALNVRGLVSMYKRDFTKAMADFDHSILLSPDGSPSYHNRGLIKYIRSDGNGAIADLNRALAANPNAAPTLYLRGLAYRKIKNEKLAQQDLAHAAEIDPKAAQVVNNLLQKLKAQ
jgi:tetratricopeptide (TPR) repeat protein